MKGAAKVVLVACTYFLVNTSQVVFGGILDKVSDTFGVSVAVAGQLNTAYALAIAIGTPLIMIASAKFDQRKLFLLSLGGLLVSTIATVALPGFFLLLIVRAWTGLAAGVCTVSGTAIIAGTVASHDQGKALYNLALGASFALILGMPITRFVTTMFDWRTIFVGMGVLFLVTMIIGGKIIPSTRGRPVASLGSQLSCLRNYRVSAILGSCVVMFISYSLIFTYVAPYIAGASPVLESSISLILMGMGIAGFIGTKVGGVLIGRIGAIRTLILGTTLQAAILGLAFAFPNSDYFPVVMLTCWTCAAWVTGPTFNLNLLLIAPEASGIMLSFNNSAMQLGNALGAGLGGIAVGYWTVNAVPNVAALLMAAAALIGLLASRLFVPKPIIPAFRNP